MNRLSVEQFHASGKIPLIVVLDNVRSMHNVGAVFRTADAFLLEGVYLCGITSQPGAVEIHKTALGAEETVDWKYFSDTQDAVRSLQQAGYTVFAIEQAHGSTPLDQVDLKNLALERGKDAAQRQERGSKFAIVMGHEVFGVQQEVVDMADGCIEIPQYGTKHSLNVSVTAGIVMYTLANQLRNN